MSFLVQSMLLFQFLLINNFVSLGASWRRGGEDKGEEQPRDRDRDADGDKGWRGDKDVRRTKNETDDDGWTTVRR